MTAADTRDPVVSVRDLRVAVRSGREWKTVVEDVSFDLPTGGSLAVVGESGAGKSMLLRSILGIHPPGVDIDIAGEVTLAGKDMRALSDRARRRHVATATGVIHQDPLRSLNPTYAVGTQLTEAHEFVPPRWSGARRRQDAVAGLRSVGFNDPEREAKRYPHQLSGGQRQRVGIAAATLLEPTLLIGDEPTTALDVTVQRRVLDLIDELRQRTGSSLLMVTHDLGVAAERCDAVLVMRHGRVIESGATAEVLRSPAHPYTRALLRSIPRLDGPRPKRLAVENSGGAA